MICFNGHIQSKVYAVKLLKKGFFTLFCDHLKGEKKLL